MKRLLIFTITTFVLALAIESVDAEPKIDRTDKFVNNLVKKGFDVKEGEYKELDFMDLYCSGTIDSCNGNNANNRYLAAVVPPLEGQADTAFEFLFRIRRNEAIVVVGPTPPPCDYYSYVSLLYSRYEEGWGPTNSHKIFSSFGDPLNRFIIKTTGGDFNKNVFLVYTADRKTNRAVRAAAKRAGFPDRVFNTVVIPSSILKTNDALDETADQVIIGQRTALWKDGSDDGGGYIEHPGVRVFRITPPDGSHDPLPMPRQMVRGSGSTEFDLGPAVEKLREAILDQNGTLVAQELITDQWVLQSPIAIQTLTDALGDSSDTTYLYTRQLFKLTDNPDDFLIVYGPNHQKTGKAVYHSITIYSGYKACGIATAYDHCYADDCLAFSGSADVYLPNEAPKIAGKLYAVKVARHCGENDPYCLEVPIAGCGEGTQLDDEMFVGFRAYIDPKTKTGPSYTELLFDRVIHFTPPPPTPVLEVGDPTYIGNYPSPVTVSFSVSEGASSTTPVSWEAKIEYPEDASGATIQPNQGVITDAEWNHFQFTAEHPGSYCLTIMVKDGQSRFAETEVTIKMK